MDPQATQIAEAVTKVIADGSGGVWNLVVTLIVAIGAQLILQIKREWSWIQDRRNGGGFNETNKRLSETNLQVRAVADTVKDVANTLHRVAIVTEKNSDKIMDEMRAVSSQLQTVREACARIEAGNK